jgi:hypothetical protein
VSDNGVTVEELEAQRAVLLRQAARIRPLVDGSLAVVHRTCRTPGCHCQRGERHEALLLCKKVSGRSHATYIPKDLADTVREWNAEYKRLRDLLREISALSEAIIRLHARSRKAARAAESATGIGEPA